MRTGATGACSEQPPKSVATATIASERRIVLEYCELTWYTVSLLEGGAWPRGSLELPVISPVLWYCAKPPQSGHGLRLLSRTRQGMFGDVVMPQARPADPNEREER